MGWPKEAAVVRLLLERKDVDANSKDGRGQTPLLLASEREHKAVWRLLLEREDFDANSKDGLDRVPLSWAANKGHKISHVMEDWDSIFDQLRGASSTSTL